MSHGPLPPQSQLFMNGQRERRSGAMSKSPKKSGKRHKRRSGNGKTSKPRTTDPAILLLALAKVVNECEKAGIRPKLKHGIVFTDAGYVLPVSNGKWAARPLKNHLGAMWLQR